MKREFLKIENNSETSEEMEKELAYIESLLEKLVNMGDMVKVNEGHKGIILEINLDNFSDKERTIFCDHFNIEYQPGISRAVKMLKVFNPNEAKKEFGVQMQAAEIVNNNEEINNDVGIPEIYFGGELTINNENLIQKLKDFGVKFSGKNELGLMMMDFVKGEDLGIYFYKLFIQENIEKFKEIEGLNEDITKEEIPAFLTGKSVDALINTCHQIMGIRAKYHYTDERPEAAQERSQIATLLMEPIKNKGFLDNEKVLALQKAITILNSQGIFHRDLHPRNIIKGEDDRLVIVDFGSAKIVDPNNKSEVDSVYKGSEADHMKDADILKILRDVAVTPEELLRDKIERDLETSFRLKRKIEQTEQLTKLTIRDKKFLDSWFKLKEGVELGDDLVNLVRQFSYDLGSYSGSQLIDNQVAGLLLLSEKSKSNKVLVFNFCDAVLQRDDFDLSFRNRMNLLREYLLLNEDKKQKKTKNKKNAA